jgi:hypothetical protein
MARFSWPIFLADFPCPIFSWGSSPISWSAFMPSYGKEKAVKGE